MTLLLAYLIVAGTGIELEWYEHATIWGVWVLHTGYHK